MGGSTTVPQRDAVSDGLGVLTGIFFVGIHGHPFRGLLVPAQRVLHLAESVERRAGHGAEQLHHLAHRRQLITVELVLLELEGKALAVGRYDLGRDGPTVLNLGLLLADLLLVERVRRRRHTPARERESSVRHRAAQRLHNWVR